MGSKNRNLKTGDLMKIELYFMCLVAYSENRLEFKQLFFFFLKQKQASLLM